MSLAELVEFANFIADNPVALNLARESRVWLALPGYEAKARITARQSLLASLGAHHPICAA
jgi:hypothetical protein